MQAANKVGSRKTRARFKRLLRALLPKMLVELSYDGECNYIFPIDFLENRGGNTTVNQKYRQTYRPGAHELKHLEHDELRELVKLIETDDNKSRICGRQKLTELKLRISAVLISSLEYQSVLDISKGLEPADFRITKKTMRLVTNELEDNLLNSKSGYEIAVPLFFFDRAGPASHHLSRTTLLERLDITRANYYLGKFSPPKSVIPPFVVVQYGALIRISGSFLDKVEPHAEAAQRSSGPDANLAPEALSLVDCVKWSISAACFACEQTVKEGPISIAGRFVGGFATGGPALHINREQVFDRPSGPQANLSPEVIEKVSDYYQAILRFLPESADLRVALSQWGRSANAPTDSNMLLDATIGLDRLFVHNHTELRFRFKLVGSCVLSATAEEREEVANSLKKIYDARGSVAHGSKSKQLSKWAPQAHKLLGEAIFIILQMFQNGTLNTSESAASQLMKLIENRLPSLRGECYS